MKCKERGQKWPWPISCRSEEKRETSVRIEGSAAKARTQRFLNASRLPAAYK